MEISNKGIKLIQDFEACARIDPETGLIHPYLDENDPPVPTVGWGSTHWENGAPVKMSDSAITQDRADSLFKSQLASFVHGVNQVVTAILTQNQFDALVSFAYNCGVPSLASSTLLRRVNANPSDQTIRDAFMMWNKVSSGGHLIESPGLSYRRTKESDFYFGA